ncbi:unnamed protein product [Hydatigera taeniaeformis]|uniref:FIST_C domain-containing protein n=1 Tax=Hydatigena taeniaeformis TaxID=6205 RepID=A0A0R3XCF0_HYDTA|nr:unnamed protein product [Hydatigera taeniaeformis]
MLLLNVDQQCSLAGKDNSEGPDAYEQVKFLCVRDALVGTYDLLQLRTAFPYVLCLGEMKGREEAGVYSGDSIFGVERLEL